MNKIKITEMPNDMREKGNKSELTTQAEHEIEKKYKYTYTERSSSRKKTRFPVYLESIEVLMVRHSNASRLVA